MSVQLHGDHGKSTGRRFALLFYVNFLKQQVLVQVLFLGNNSQDCQLQQNTGYQTLSQRGTEEEVIKDRLTI